MAQATVQTDRRSVKAAAIVERQETHLRDDGSWQVRDSAGSGRWHTVLDNHCSCADYVYRGVTCKHLRAVMQSERELAQYGATWDARSEQQRQTVDRGPDQSPHCPDCGSRLESQSYYIGGRGMLVFLVCTKEAQHKALPA